jgi:hypothetical protein
MQPADRLIRSRPHPARGRLVLWGGLGAGALALSSLAAFAQGHALMINVSPSLPYWALWVTAARCAPRRHHPVRSARLAAAGEAFRGGAEAVRQAGERCAGRHRHRAKPHLLRQWAGRRQPSLRAASANRWRSGPRARSARLLLRHQRTQGRFRQPLCRDRLDLRHAFSGSGGRSCEAAHLAPFAPLRLRCHGHPQASARDYGQHGTVWPVIEPDLLEQIHARLTQLEKTGETARLNEELKRRTIARVNRPEPVAGDLRRLGARSWRFDPTITVERDIADDKGRVIIAAGTRVNPLDTVPLRAPLVFLDGDDPGTACLGHPSLCQHEGQAHPRARRAARTDESPPAALLLRPGRHAGEALRHSRGARNRRAAGPRALITEQPITPKGASAIMRRNLAFCHGFAEHFCSPA